MIPPAKQLQHSYLKYAGAQLCFLRAVLLDAGMHLASSVILVLISTSFYSQTNSSWILRCVAPVLNTPNKCMFNEEQGDNMKLFFFFFKSFDHWDCFWIVCLQQSWAWKRFHLLKKAKNKHNTHTHTTESSNIQWKMQNSTGRQMHI